jgi:hypothetical protein
MTAREHVQRVLARCYVAVAMADYDLRRWDEELHPSAPVIDLRTRARVR